jgi:hypothetical protein
MIKKTQREADLLCRLKERRRVTGGDELITYHHKNILGRFRPFQR